MHNWGFVTNQVKQDGIKIDVHAVYGCVFVEPFYNLLSNSHIHAMTSTSCLYFLAFLVITRPQNKMLSIYLAQLYGNREKLLYLLFLRLLTT